MLFFNVREWLSQAFRGFRAAATPSLTFLSNYDAVLVWFGNVFQDPIQLGNSLAVFADNGKGAVTAWSSSLGRSSLGGSWASEGYAAVTHAGLAA